MTRSRGKRSNSSQASRKQAYVERATQAALAHAVRITARRTLPLEFVNTRMDRRVPLAYASAFLVNGVYAPQPVFKGAESETTNIRVFCEATPDDEARYGPGGIDKNWVKHLPPHVLAWLDTHPRTHLYAARFVNQISMAAEAEIFLLWRQIVAAGLHIGEKNGNRSSTPAAHFGLWNVQSNPLNIASDGLQEVAYRRTPEQLDLVRARIRFFMQRIKDLVVPQLQAVIAREEPLMAALTPIIQAFIRQQLGDLGDNNCFNLESCFTMVAVKEGSSEIPHADWNDSESMPSAVLTFSVDGFIGGDLNLPQLKGRMPIFRRSLGLARTRVLCHWATPFSGDRLVMTFFLPASVARAALAAAPREYLV